MPKAKKPESIALGTKARQTLGSLLGQVNTYIRATKDALNVPDDWVVQHDQQGIPAAFVPPKEKE